MHEDPILTDVDRIQEELVAYLDGELDADASDRVEARLRSDPSYRQKLKELQAAWDLLDELPRVPVSDSFTQTTVEMVALTAETEAQTAAKQVDQRKWWGWSALAACIVAAGLGGYVAVSQRLDQPNQKLVEDLPVIEKVDLYRVADSVDFLRSLEAEQLFLEEQPDVP